MNPSYLYLDKARFEERIRRLYQILEECTLCARECRISRVKGEIGFCRSGMELQISSIFPHFGEEPPLVGKHGSGTVFLTNCNLRCVFCQNHEISQGEGEGEYLTPEELAKGMLHLQGRGCHNINFVTPTHFAPQLIHSVKLAAEQGLRIPIVWNCGGYESVEVIRLLDGIVDIYMPDIKYRDGANAKRYSVAPNYFEKVKAAVSEMHEQVGNLRIEDGIASRGLLIRHLVLPNRIAGSEEILKFIAGLSEDNYVNIMDQYRPCHKAYDYPELSRRITQEEFSEVIEKALDLGLHRGFSKRRAYIWEIF